MGEREGLEVDWLRRNEFLGEIEVNSEDLGEAKGDGSLLDGL